MTLQSVTIKSNNYYYIRGEAVFVLRGRAMDANTPVDFRVSVPKDELYHWSADASYSQPSALVRVVEFQLSTPNMTSPEIMKSQDPDPRPLRLTGRFSADNRWPLAFECEPIDRLQTKAGQQLGFKTWPAPLPPHATARLK